MIENIKREFVSYGNESTYRDDKKQIFDYLSILKHTTNQLVDAVNNQQIQLNNHECRLLDLHSEITALDDTTYHEAEPKNRMIGCTTFDKVESKMNPEIDLYAEEKKWIGKLCKCWDSNINDDIWGILQDIKDNKTEKYYLYGIGYEHCEPVKPDDDIIFKGE